MDDFASDTDSDYTSYWRDWVSVSFLSSLKPTQGRSSKWHYPFRERFLEIHSTTILLMVIGNIIVRGMLNFSVRE
jgi:hypothetical protein